MGFPDQILLELDLLDAEALSLYLRRMRPKVGWTEAVDRIYRALDLEIHKARKVARSRPQPFGVPASQPAPTAGGTALEQASDRPARSKTGTGRSPTKGT